MRWVEMATFGRCLAYLIVYLTYLITLHQGVIQQRNIDNMTNQNNANNAPTDSPPLAEDSTLQMYGEGLSSSRQVVLETNEELDEFVRQLASHIISNNGQMDETTESWLDSEFNRIYVTYAYPDVTKVN